MYRPNGSSVDTERWNKADTIRLGWQDTRSKEVIGTSLEGHAKQGRERERERAASGRVLRGTQKGGGKLAVFNLEGEQRYKPTALQFAGQQSAKRRLNYYHLSNAAEQHCNLFDKKRVRIEVSLK